MEQDDKNNPKGTGVDESRPQLWMARNGQDQDGNFEKAFLYLVFCIRGKAEFGFGPVYRRALDAGKVFIIYHPEESLPYRLYTDEDTRIVFVRLPLAELHQMFVPELMEAPVFRQENINRKYYEEREIPAEIHQILFSLYDHHLPANAQRIYHQAKATEILSLFFSSGKPDTESCPFLNDEEVIRKLKQVKEILMQQYAEPPTLAELARLAGLNEYQLKAGFKEIYGSPPYQYLMNHKLEIAKGMLMTGNYQVGEVADHIGYQNVSHFISAFKKKYGLTPKKLTK